MSMKIFTTILIAIALLLIAYNVTLIDFKKPLEGNSAVALIGIVAALCAVLILLIFKMSKKIEDKLKNQ
jgi:hypothetical protein